MFSEDSLRSLAKELHLIQLMATHTMNFTYLLETSSPPAMDFITLQGKSTQKFPTIDGSNIY